ASRRCSFPFSSAGYCRDLPSFPTRRSSDLAAIFDGGVDGLLRRHFQRVNIRRLRRIRGRQCQPHLDDCPFCSAHSRDFSAVFNRSEEHTSELQSRENLVCRLLLEKKKI